MSEDVLSFDEIRKLTAPIAKKHNAKNVYLFGSYAREEATPDSDLDFLVLGGNGFVPSSIFVMQQELSRASGKEVDAFEMRELNVGTKFYDNVMKERRLVV